MVIADTRYVIAYADQPATLVVLAEQLGDGRILSTDARDFRVYRWSNRRPFENLLVRRMRGGHV